ncbi:MAG: hypothetical protein HOQ11_10190 [Gemmatimonadaceae bacterium]|nr:hypothetical protein [Gemmatimonadaceae bacterium]NUQ92849.1 hypothetical protein [Gemmatimonadaceae bacterium]NUR19530.1 hypothetical protein [Gemmatimonadaceae bacterium]NUS97760.1 hypothetical protein [Gemmatimonadaceae bacterium]
MLIEYQVVHVKATGKHHRRYDAQFSEEEFQAFVEASAPERPLGWKPSASHRALHAEIAKALASSRDLTKRRSA